MARVSENATHQLAELVSTVVGVLPRDAATEAGGVGGAQLVTIRRREADRFLATWSIGAPSPGEEVRLHVVGDSAVFALAGTVVGSLDERSRFLVFSEVRRKTQRRESDRGQIDDLVVISHEGDIDGKLVDISGDGVGFELDRPLPMDTSFRAIINFQGSVIPTTAEVRNARRLDDGRYRLGCAFVEIADRHRALLHTYAAQRPIDRRTPEALAAQRLGFLRRLRDAA
jgi:PilZ domain